MIEKVAIKSVDMPVTNQNNATVYIKLLNFLPGSTKTLRIDQTAVTTPDNAIAVSDTLRDAAGRSFIVADITQDYHKARWIRNCLSMITANNTATILRPTVASNGQGGISGQSNATVATAVPCKIGTISMTHNNDLDITINRFAMLISKRTPVLIGDTIRFANTYEDARVEGVKYDTPGLQEVVFEKDPRWKSA